MSVLRVAVTPAWTKLADAGAFVIQNLGHTGLEFAVVDIAPAATDLGGRVLLNYGDTLDAFTYEEDIYVRGIGGVPGVVGLAAVAAVV